MVSESVETTRQFTLGVEVPIAVPPIRVWKALIEPDDMVRWFCERADVDRRLSGRFDFGGRYTFRLEGEGAAQSTLDGFETGRSLAFSWSLGGRRTRVRYVLAGVRGDCRLRVFQEHAGSPHTDWRGQPADHYPWEVYLLNLKMYLERGNAGVRVDYEAIPSGRHEITGEVRCASERIWRVLTDPEECSNRAGTTLTFQPSKGEGWVDPMGAVRVSEAISGKRLVQEWRDADLGDVTVVWDLVSKGVSSELTLTTWGEGRAAAWHESKNALWTHLLWSRAFNQLKYYSETGRPSGLKRLAGDA